MKREKNILITGHPGIGKTTVVKKLAKELTALHPAGFYTSEIRERGVRKGFQLVSLDGIKRTLSHVDMNSPYRVSKYGVDVKGFEIFLDSLSLFDPTTFIVIIDEIGSMECFSGKFRSIVKDILGSEKLLVATIALKGSGIIGDIKKRDDVKLFHVTPESRDALPKEILKAIRDLGVSA